MSEVIARVQVASTLLKHLEELMASLLSGVIEPNPPAMPQFVLLGWALLPDSLEAEDENISFHFFICPRAEKFFPFPRKN